VIRKLLGKVREVARGRRTQGSGAGGADHAAAATPSQQPLQKPDCKVTFVDHGKSTLVHRGNTLLQAVVRAGVPLPHECGGLATCGECRVAKVAGEVSDQREIETKVLKIMGKPLDGRLACQTLVFGEVSVTVADPD